MTMVHSCSALNCTQRYQKESDVPISFHNFPKDKDLRDQWLVKMRRENWQPSMKSKLCSLHFTDSCYDSSPWSSQKRLKLNAIPTVFDFLEHLRKKTATRRSPKKRNWVDPVTEGLELKSPVLSATEVTGSTSHQ